MKRMWLYCIAVASVAIITAMFIVFADDTDNINTEFLSSFGWRVSPHSIEQVPVTLPDTPDTIYNDYNRLQKEAGLDLTPYYGSQAIRYTYIVLNYPIDITDSQIRANVLCVDGRPIAGDIMTVSSDGFMHSLVFPY